MTSPDLPACPDARIPRTSVPICAAPPPNPRPAISGRRSAGGDVIALYLAVSIYVAFDVCVFHLLSGWLTGVLEVAELAPIVVGACAYRRAKAKRDAGWQALPRIVTVPVIATAIQLQMLALAGAYRLLAPT